MRLYRLVMAVIRPFLFFLENYEDYLSDMENCKFQNCPFRFFTWYRKKKEVEEDEGGSIIQNIGNFRRENRGKRNKRNRAN